MLTSLARSVSPATVGRDADSSLEIKEILVAQFQHDLQTVYCQILNAQDATLRE
jgi:hypothetical protein